MRRSAQRALRLAFRSAESCVNNSHTSTQACHTGLCGAPSLAVSQLQQDQPSTSYSRHTWGPSIRSYQAPRNLQTAAVQPQGSSIQSQALDDATSISHVDPYAVVQPEVKAISERLRHSVSSTVPVLKQAAEYFFRKGVEGKRLRPTLVMLMASALADAAPAAEYHGVDLRPASEPTHELRRRQQRIAEIAELIHVASLLHDDVIDEASTRRGILSLNATVGNKVSILSGDFLLARASVTLGALRNTEIVELMSQILEYLVSGEIMQMTASQEQTLDMEHYLQKTYCKTASLMANCMRAVAVLECSSPEVCSTAWSYGRHLGLAFQIVDDVLDLTGSSSILGKPALNDLKSGVATAPVLYAAQQQPELCTLIRRKFKGQGDLDLAVQLINQTDGIQRARDLAKHHCLMAAKMVHDLPQPASDHAILARQALIVMTHKLLDRKR